MKAKLNERAWAGHIIAWIKEAINNGTTIFQEATNDAGIKLKTGVTKFPDVLLFTDKVSGIVFNGWELKFPDTPADDEAMLLNAIEKAELLQSNSFVTWNGIEAIIWKITDSIYSLESLSKLKSYPAEKGITSRSDLDSQESYQKFEPALRKRLFEILHDLEQLYKDGDLKEAINISSSIVLAVSETAKYLIPQFEKLIESRKGESVAFRNEFSNWKILESSTLKILGSSSRRVENVVPENVLAKFFFYKLIGKILFYQVLSENLSGKVSKLAFTSPVALQLQLKNFFDEAKKIDYQAVFESDFTDELQFNSAVENVLFSLIGKFNEFDFQILPTEVVGNILENLVPKTEKQKFGQYFTPERLANLVAFSAIKTRNDTAFDPTCGTGTLLTSFYNILRYYGQRNHRQLLDQVWGNDISHFPAVLSVINIYKQALADKSNFPRITRLDYFSLLPHQELKFPDAADIEKLNTVELPMFDAIVSNFPFVRQEDIPSDILSERLRHEFGKTQGAFIQGGNFKLNEHSDYYIYCFYNSLKFLKDGGYLAAITSNAWLGKDYGIQFKQFLLDNFSIEYVFQSKAEHWFEDSQVSTISITLQKSQEKKPTKFVTLNFKLNDYFKEADRIDHLKQFELLYEEIDSCDNPLNKNWESDVEFKGVYNKSDGTITVSIIDREYMLRSLTTEENWAINFIAQHPLSIFEKSLINPFPKIFDVGRGTKVEKNDMFLLSSAEAKQLDIEREFLIPVLKSSREVTQILHLEPLDTFLFSCDKPLDELKRSFPNTYSWIKKWEVEKNKTGILLPLALKSKKPFWYTQYPEQKANIFISVNPNRRLFFSYSSTGIHLDQRLVAIRVDKNDCELIAALLNSIVSLLLVELNGVSRNLGALDLNASFFKKRMKMLNPALLSEDKKRNILQKFRPLASRKILDYNEELNADDRKAFDKTVLEAFGYSANLVERLYKILSQIVTDRVEMKNR